MNYPTPCHRQFDLFFASDADLRYPDGSPPRPEAVTICRTCPQRRACAQEAIRFEDRHTVRAGQRLWVRSERAIARAIAEGRFR